MNSMLVNGVDISTYDLFLLKIPPVIKPERRARKITIPGRSGYLTEWSGDYESYTKEPELLYFGSSLDTVMDFLRSAHTVTFGNEPTYAYEVRADEIVSSEHGKGGEYIIKVAYETQPLKKLATEAVSEDATTYSITNLGNEPAYPKLVITGAGEQTVTIGAQTVAIDFAIAGETITIDSLNGQIYDASGDNAWNKVTGDLPVIPVSSSAITVSTTGTVLTIYPNWRWA